MSERDHVISQHNLMTSEIGERRDEVNNLRSKMKRLEIDMGRLLLADGRRKVSCMDRHRDHFAVKRRAYVRGDDKEKVFIIMKVTPCFVDLWSSDRVIRKHKNNVVLIN